MMNFPGHAAGRPWCYPYDDAGEAAAAASGSFTAMIADHYTDDLFDDLPWEQGGGGGPGPGSATTAQPAAEQPCRWSPRFKPPPEVRRDPPSEDEMAAWLRTIVKGEEHAYTGGGGREQAAGVAGTKGSTDASTTTDNKEKLPMMEEGTTMGTKLEMRKPPAAGGGSTARRSHPHHGEAHSLTEKRRRHKINEKLRTLQQLVPGCDNKSNQASTLDQTIQYMKSLQQHVQAMSFAPARPAAAAAYHVVQPHHAPPGAPPVDVAMMPAAPVVLAAPAPATMVVPFGAMLQLPHYPAAGVPVMMPAATAAPLYPAARAAAAPEGASRSSASHRHGSSSRKGKGGGSLRKKH